MGAFLSVTLGVLLLLLLVDMTKSDNVDPFDSQVGYYIFILLLRTGLGVGGIVLLIGGIKPLMFGG